MLAAGMPLEMALQAAEAFEAEVDLSGVTARQARNRRYYEKRKAQASEQDAERLKASESSETVLKRLDASETKTAEPPLTRVVDKPLTGLDILPNPTTPHGASDALAWPGVPPAKPELDALEAALTEAAGSALASVAVAPRLRVLAPILSLAKPGTGPPCDLQADVLPVIRARSASAKPGSVRSWEFFTAAILEARDRRLSGAPQVQAPTHDRQPSRPDRPARPNPREDRLERMLAGAVASIDG
jgi:hypothetical protein